MLSQPRLCSRRPATFSQPEPGGKTNDMSVAWKLAFLAVFPAACVTGDDGDDFSNNLFSDLAP